MDNQKRQDCFDCSEIDSLCIAPGFLDTERGSHRDRRFARLRPV